MKNVICVLCLLFVLCLPAGVPAAEFSVHGNVVLRQDMGDADELKAVVGDPTSGGDNEKNRDFQNIYTDALDVWVDSKINEKIDARLGFSGKGKGQTNVVLSDTYISHKIDCVGDFRVAYCKPEFGLDAALFGEELGVGGTSTERFDERHWQLVLNGKADIVNYSLALIDGFGHDTTTSIRPRSSKDYYLDISTETAGGRLRVGGSYYNDRIAEDAEGDVSKYGFYLTYAGSDFDFKSQYTAYINKDKFSSKDVVSYGYWLNMDYRFYERVLGVLSYSAWDKYREISPQLEFSLAENTDFRIAYFKYDGPGGLRAFDSDIFRTELEVSF